MFTGSAGGIVESMTSPLTPGMESGHSQAPTRTPKLSWPLIAGLGSLALLWPLTALLGFDSGAPRALILLALTAVIWIGVVGLGRVARPILTLALAGLGYAVISLVVSLIVGAGGPFGAGPQAVIGALVTQTLWGVVAGLIAAVVQRARGVRR